MKYLKKFESFSNINEEFTIPGVDKLKDFYNKNKEAVDKFFAELKSIPELEEKIFSTEVKEDEISKAENDLEEVKNVEDEEVVTENFFKKLASKTMKSIGTVAMIAGGLGSLGSLIMAALAEDGLIDKVKGFYPAGMPVGYFVAMCILVAVSGLLINKAGKAIEK